MIWRHKFFLEFLLGWHSYKLLPTPGLNLMISCHQVCKDSTVREASITGAPLNSRSMEEKELRSVGAFRFFQSPQWGMEGRCEREERENALLLPQGQARVHRR